MSDVHVLLNDPDTAGVALDERQIVEVGTPEHFFTDPQEDRTKIFQQEILPNL